MRGHISKQEEPQDFADTTTEEASVDIQPKKTFFDKDDLPGYIPKPRFGAKMPIESEGEIEVQPIFSFQTKPALVQGYNNKPRKFEKLGFKRQRMMPTTEGLMDFPVQRQNEDAWMAFERNEFTRNIKPTARKVWSPLPTQIHN